MRRHISGDETPGERAVPSHMRGQHWGLPLRHPASNAKLPPLRPACDTRPMTPARAALASFLVAACVSPLSCGGDNTPAGGVSADGAPDATAPDAATSDGFAAQTAAIDRAA